jgi:3-oxoacyl-[acyl-carrier protein] reductase
MEKPKIALVTGATRGIGQAVAKKLAQQGLLVIGTATTAEGAQSITDYLQNFSIKGRGIVLNVTNYTEVEKTIQSFITELGPIQILVNNAGITRDNLMLRMKFEEWKDVIDTNLTSVFYVTQCCLRDMLKSRWGRIVNISSVVGTMGNPGQVNYCAAKAGILGFTKALAREVAIRGVTVNAVAPGFIDTQMTQKLTEDQRNAILHTIPIQRVGTPDDIAHAVSFLVSDKANYITGQTLHVNGGMLME